MSVRPTACFDPKSAIYNAPECQAARAATPSTPPEIKEIIRLVCPPTIFKRYHPPIDRKPTDQPRWRFSPDQIERLLRELRARDAYDPRHVNS